MSDDEDDVPIVIKCLDDNTTHIFDPKAANIGYVEIPKLHTESVWASYWSEVKLAEEEMWDAVQSRSLSKLQQLFDKKNQEQVPIQVNSESLDRWTAFHYACFEGDPAIVEFLVKKGANVEAKTSINRTGLHLATIKQKTEVVKFLVARLKVDLNTQDADKCTALHYASMYGYDEIVAILLAEKQRLDLKLRNNQNMTASECALDIKTYKLFSEMSKEQDSYSRTILGDTIRRSSRVDHVEKLMAMTAYLKKVHSAQNTVEETAEKKDEKRKQKFEKLNKVNKVFVQKISTAMGPNSFQIIDSLGKGAFGEVFLVRKKGEQQGPLYAMKVLQKDKVFKQNLTKYVMAERTILTLMDNPFIVKIYSAFQTNDKLFLILEYCPGGDLEKKIIRQKKIDEEIVKIYAAQIVLALESLHKRQIIFRDLKPANVVLDADGHAKITDFGLSKQAQASKSFCGSVAYLAPEMLMNKRHGFTLDWYLLGLLIYQLIDGMPPYYCLNRQRLFHNIKHMKLPIPKNITPQCENLLVRLLERDPQRRLGAISDALEIKKHPWFKNIDWDEALQMKLTPPKIRERVIMPRKIDFDKIEGQVNQTGDISGEKKLNGWSFFVPSPDQ